MPQPPRPGHFFPPNMGLGAVFGVLALALGSAVGAADHTVDVAVYDASSGGVIAAVAAARHGARTLLICASWPACQLSVPTAIETPRSG